MRKKRRKNEENRLLSQNQDSEIPGQKSLGQSLQYSYVSVISRFPLKTVHPFRKFLAVLPPLTLYKVETRKKILDIRVQHCLWGGGGGRTCVDWKTPQKSKSVPRLLSMIVGRRRDVNDNWTAYKDIFFAKVDDCIPNYRQKKRLTAPWITKDLLKFIGRKNVCTRKQNRQEEI